MKHNQFMIMIVAAATIIGATTADAHHSFAAAYLEDEIQQIEGELVLFSYRNPHTFVHVDVAEENGEIHRYIVEWGSVTQLSTQRITRNTLRTGDRLIINGNPGRNPIDRRVRMLNLLRPSDGFRWGYEGETFD